MLNAWAKKGIFRTESRIKPTYLLHKMSRYLKTTRPKKYSDRGISCVIFGEGIFRIEFLFVYKYIYTYIVFVYNCIKHAKEYFSNKFCTFFFSTYFEYFKHIKINQKDNAAVIFIEIFLNFKVYYVLYKFTFFEILSQFFHFYFLSQFQFSYLDFSQTAKVD